MSTVFRRPHDYRVKFSPIFTLLAVASATSGVAAVTITPTGTITGLGQLAGTCSIGFGATATSQGSNCSGTAAMAISGAAAPIAVGQMTGVAALVLDGSATLSSDVAYALAQRRPLRRWAIPPYDFTAYQTKTVILSLPSETGVAGQVDITFTPTATLRGAGVLAGASANTFGGAGLLRGTGVLAGTAAIAITPTASLVNGASGVITASSDMAFGGAGVVRGSGSVLGQASMLMSATMLTGSSQPLVGSASMILSAQGTLSLAGEFKVRHIEFTALKPRIKIAVV